MADLGGNKTIDKEEVKQKIRQEIAISNAQEIMSNKSIDLLDFDGKSIQLPGNKMVDKCFKKCIDKPGTSLDSYEQKCLAMCMDRFLDSWQLVSKSYLNRLKRETEQI